MHDTQRFAISIALFDGGYGPCSANGRNVRALVSRMLIIAGGLMPSSLSVGFSPCTKPMSWRANPDEETTDWRAVCGRTACTVRRAGRVSAFPDPYQLQLDCLIPAPNIAPPRSLTRLPNEAGLSPNSLNSSTLARQTSRLGCLLLGRRSTQSNILTPLLPSGEGYRRSTGLCTPR